MNPLKIRHILFGIKLTCFGLTVVRGLCRGGTIQYSTVLAEMSSVEAAQYVQYSTVQAEMGRDGHSPQPKVSVANTVLVNGRVSEYQITPPCTHTVLS